MASILEVTAASLVEKWRTEAEARSDGGTRTYCGVAAAHLRWCADELAAALPAQTETCEWKQDEFDELNTFNTSCGNAFLLYDGNVAESGFKFCVYCGRGLA